MKVRSYEERTGCLVFLEERTNRLIIELFKKGLSSDRANEMFTMKRTDFRRRNGKL